MRSVRVAIVVITLLVCATALLAQNVTGSIAGTVTDPTGAVVPNATVTITNTDTNVVARTVKTDAGGNYSAPLLPVGHYSLTVEAPGFQKYVQTGIIVNVNDRLTFSPKLTVGSSQQEVTVEATAHQVDLQSTQAAAVISGTQVRELALNGRNWEQLLTLSPGVSQANDIDQIYVGAFAPQGTNIVGFSMNGGRREHNNYMIDGADNVDRGSNLTLLSFPSVDAISEFRVLRGQYDPEYGRAGGAQVNVITRSGTSSLHGNAFEFWRNDALNARPFASKYPTVTPHIPYLRYHNFGGTLGGPVWIPKIYEQRNKTFFFFSEEVRRNLTYTNSIATVPTQAMLSGNFAHPVCVAFKPDNSCAATGTSISSINPVSQAYIQDVFSKFPRPNAGPFGFSGTMKNLFNFREEIIKIDHVFSQRFSIAGKLLRDNIPTEEAVGLFTGTGSNAIPGVNTTSTNSPGHQYNLRATISLSPNLLIEPGYNYSYGAILSDPIGVTARKNSPNVASAVDPILPFKSVLDRIPNTTFTGGTGAVSFGQYRDFNRNHTAFGNATWVKGGHTIKWGGTYYHYNKSENAGGNNAGTFAFNANGLPSSGGAVDFEQSWANFLLGRIATFSQTSLDLVADINDNQFEYYAQDTWRIRPNLTLTFGARHSLFRQPTDAKGLMAQFDPAAYDPNKAPCILANGNLDITFSGGKITSACNPNFSPFNGVIFAGTPPPGGVKSPYGNKLGKEYNAGIAPRIGIAWDPWNDGRTSLRAGFGMFYDNGIIFGNAENNVFVGNAFQQSLTVTNTTFASTTTGGCPTGQVGTPPNCVSQAAPRLQSRLPIDYKYPYTTQWSLDLQREIAPGWIFDLGYYGNVGKRLPGFYDINQPAENAWRNCTVATPCFAGPNSTNPVNFFNAALTTSGGATTTRPAGYYVGTGNTTKLNVLRPFIGWNGADAVRNMYDSNYNGLQAQLQRQFRGNSLINLAYTWSHTLTTYVADRSTGSIMPLQGHVRDNNYGPGVGDRRHVFTANFVWELPWFSNQQGIGRLLGGWQVSGIQTFQTGLPATVQSNQLFDPTGAGCLGPSPCVFRANQVGDPNLGEPRSFENWFNGAAFANPGLSFSASCPTFPAPTSSVPADCAAFMAQTTVPTERPGSLRLPGFWRTDLSLYKNIRFTERFSGQLRFESFNTFNHTNPICCNSFTTNSATFNTIRSARDPRILQLGMKLNF